MKVHPVAELFPMLPAEELDALAESIRDVGLLEPIVVDPEGLLLDGRSRLAACELVGVEPESRVYEGEPVAFILGLNLARRHLNVGQRAIIAAKARSLAPAWSKGRPTQRAIAQEADVGNASVARADAVLDRAPDLADRIMLGDLSLGAAYEEVQRRERDEARLAALPDDLAERVRAGATSLDEAETVIREQGVRRAVMADDVRHVLQRLTAWAEWMPNIPPELMEVLDERQQYLLWRVLGTVVDLVQEESEREGAGAL